MNPLLDPDRRAADRPHRTALTEGRDPHAVLVRSRWRSAQADNCVQWPQALATAPARRRSTIAVIDLAFTADVAATVSGALSMKRFGVRPFACGPYARHGTAICALAAGHCALPGWLPGIDVLAASVGSAGGIARGPDVAAAILWSLTEDVDVIALPMGDIDSDGDVEMAIAACAASPRPPLVLASLGDVYPSRGLFPARHPLVTSVAAADDDGRLVAQACRVPAPDLLAPGDRIAAPTGAGEARLMTGSSVACALAASVALQCLSRTHGNLRRADLLAAMCGRDVRPSASSRKKDDRNA